MFQGLFIKYKLHGHYAFIHDPRPWFRSMHVCMMHIFMTLYLCSMILDSCMYDAVLFGDEPTNRQGNSRPIGVGLPKWRKRIRCEIETLHMNLLPTWTPPRPPRPMTKTKTLGQIVLMTMTTWDEVPFKSICNLSNWLVPALQQRMCDHSMP